MKRKSEKHKTIKGKERILVVDLRR